MKFRLRRWLVLPLLATILAVGLVGCTSRPSDEELTARFSGLNGIASIETHCSQPLPWNWDCRISIAPKPKVSAADLALIIKSTGDLRLKVINSLKPTSAGDLTMDIKDPSDIDAVELAKAYALAEAQQNLDSFRVDRTFPVGGGSSYSAELSLSSPKNFNEVANLAALLTDNAALSKASVLSSSFALTALDRQLPLAGISLVDQITKKYPVIGAKIDAGFLEVRLPTSANRTAAIAFASKLPQYSHIDQVYLENNPIITRQDVTPGSAAALESLMDLLRNQPALKAISAKKNSLNITLPDLPRLKEVDGILSAHPAYHQVQINYSLGWSRVSIPPARTVPLSPFVKLLEDGRLESVIMGVSEQDGLNVSVRATQNISAYDLGKLLALSGLGDPVAQVNVRVSPKSQGDSWNLKFSTADPGHIPDGKKVDANRIKELADGWQAGKDSLGK